MSICVLIEDAKALAKRYNNQAIVILGVERDGTVTVVTYGETKYKCRAIGEWAKGLWQHAVSVVPFRTVFGWGNDGKPKALTAEQLDSMSPTARAYARKWPPPK
jgi:hypothetical protein